MNRIRRQLEEEGVPDVFAEGLALEWAAASRFIESFENDRPEEVRDMLERAKEIQREVLLSPRYFRRDGA